MGVNVLYPDDDVFYGDNCEPSSERGDYIEAFTDVVRSLGLRPVFYNGAGADTKNSSLDREIRDDFYKAKAAVIRVSPPKLEDNWVVDERKNAPSTSQHSIFLVYSMAAISDLSWAAGSIQISSAKEFSTSLRAELSKSMAG
jgi:hypothetical protein